MAIPAWNFDWTSDDSWIKALFDVRVYDEFVDAVNERLAVVPTGSSTPMTPIAHGATGDDILQKWRDLAAAVVGMWYGSSLPHGKCFWPAYDGSGSAIAYSGAYALGTEDPADIPIRRRYPRQITVLSAAGTTGQIARYVGIEGGSAVPLYGKIVKYDGTAWVRDASDAMPDILTAASIGESSISDGDYFGISVTAPAGGGSWFLNDLRDAINQLVLSSIAVWVDGLGEPITSPADPGFFSLTWDNNGENNFQSAQSAPVNVAGIQAAAESAYASAAASASDAEPIAKNRTTNGTGTLGANLLRRYCYPLLWSIPGGGTINRTVNFVTFHVPEGSGSTFDALGDGVNANGWYALGESAAANAASVRGAKFGSLAAPIPWGSPDAPAGDGIAYGYDLAIASGVGGLTALLRWDVTGGFAYTG